MTRPRASAAAERLEGLEALDPPAQKLGKLIRDAVPDGPVKDGLSGTWLGHALHPLLTDVPIGAYVSALVLDLTGEGSAADKLIAFGLAATPAVLATGWSDWADSEMGDPSVRRTGLIHAALNGGATALMGASLLSRRRGERGRGRLLALAGMGLLGGGGWLGGHLSYARGVGVDTTVFDKELEAWTQTEVSEADLAGGTAVCALTDGVPVMLVRRGERILALHDRCSHRGGPLHEGELTDTTVTCPWHNSVFCLADGSVERGPATFPQPVFDARVTDGRVEVRLRARPTAPAPSEA